MSDITRIVVRAPNWLGDAVMALPAIGSVRAAFADAHLAVAAVPSIAPLFDEHTNAGQNHVLTIDSSRREWRVLAAGQFDAIVLLPNSFRTARAAKRAWIGERWGYATQFRRWFLTRAVPTPRTRLHQSHYYQELVRELGLPLTGERPKISVQPVTAARADALLAKSAVVPGTPMIGFAPGAAYGHAKRWPPRRVADAIGRLSRDGGAVCVLFGADGDREAGREIESSLPSDVRVVNLIARTDLRLLAGVVAKCSAFVSNDSGAMHLAAALGVPVTAIFGPTDERVTAPFDVTGSKTDTPDRVTHDVLTHSVFCRPCMLRDCPIDHRCMKGITVDAVVASVMRRLEAWPEHRRGAVR
jgi:lipopolysaccharide heptosyltransferase II